VGAKWSPEKNLIIVTEWHGGFDGGYGILWLMDNQGEYLYKLKEDGFDPYWSTNGEKVLFSSIDRLNNIFLIDIDGTNEQHVVVADSFNWYVSDWSVNGEYILVNEQDEQLISDPEVVLLELSKKKRTPLTNNNVRDLGGKWSPDESQIVYISGMYTAGYQIIIMNSDGSNNLIMVEALELYDSVYWSPQGDEIAFSRTKKLDGYAKYARGNDLFVLNLNSGEIRQLTKFAEDSISVYVQDWK
jgi:Tol biopolymer transport system component